MTATTAQSEQLNTRGHSPNIASDQQRGASENLVSNIAHHNFASTLARLHTRLLAGDVQARDDLSRLLLHVTSHRLRRKMPSVDPAVIEDAVEDELMKHLCVPCAYDPSRSTLDRYIALGATHNVMDALRRNQRRLKHEVPIGDNWPEVAISFSTARLWSGELRLALKVTNTKQERVFLCARLRGERRTVVLARILGLDSVPIHEQQAAVHRTWVRLRSRIRRRRLRHEAPSVRTG